MNPELEGTRPFPAIENVERRLEELHRITIARASWLSDGKYQGDTPLDWELE